MRKNLNRGFTLIELLVVIAIIGILSSIVLTSLGASRDKAKRARIIADLMQARTLMEINATNGLYNTLNSPEFTIIENDVKATQGGSGTTLGIYQSDGGVTSPDNAWTDTLPNNSSSFCLKATYGPSGGPGWCLDSQGNSLSLESPVTVGSRCRTSAPFCK